jgi:hypothetical protein
MQNKNEIFADNGLSNIFNGALISKAKIQPTYIHNYEVIGYRLESNEVEGVKVAERKPEDFYGVYVAVVYFQTIRRRAKATNSVFFPRHWTREKVIDAIFEAYQNKSVRDAVKEKYNGKTLDGMPIVLWLDKEGKVFDAMPFRDIARGLNRKGRTCKICGMNKHLICLKNHQHKGKPFIRKLLGRIRYCSRKFYFNAAGKLGLEG